jgi:peptide/nickel transport system permease protein
MTAASFVLSKLVRTALTLLLVVTLVFVILRMAGDPLLVLLPADTDPVVVEQYRARWGLDRPMLEQYGYFVSSVLKGDLGRSFRDGREAIDVVLERLPKTLELGAAAMALAILIGIPAGVMAALRRGTYVDRALMMVSVLGYSLPTFFLGVLLILLFSLTLRWLPSSGTGTLLHLVMPAVTLGTWIAASLARFTRSAMLDVLSQPYMRTARAKGLPQFVRIMRHALPNAAIPIVTLLGMTLGHLIGGAVVIETVFAWPGIGRLTVTSVAARELAVVQTIVLLVAASMITANLIVDLLYGWLDPRLRGLR